MLRSNMSNTGNERQPIVNLNIRGMVNAGSHAALLTLGNACMVRTGLAKESQTETSEKPFFSLTKNVVPTSPSPFAPWGKARRKIKEEHRCLNRSGKHLIQHQQASPPETENSILKDMESYFVICMIS